MFSERFFSFCCHIYYKSHKFIRVIVLRRTNYDDDDIHIQKVARHLPRDNKQIRKSLQQRYFSKILIKYLKKKIVSITSYYQAQKQIIHQAE